MNNINHTIEINAPREKVWQVLWDDATYRKWTSAFHEGSHAVSDWKQGSSIHFIGPDGSGMFSVIQTLDAPSTMIFKHLGVLHEGKEVPPTPETEAWSGGTEEYYLTEEHGKTKLRVSSYAPPEYVEIFNTAFDKGFVIVKELSEN
jgi:uncharacterized protein YndB with AHSA1/START domain